MNSTGTNAHGTQRLVSHGDATSAPIVIDGRRGLPKE